MTWDTYTDLQMALEMYADANECSYILLMVQDSEVNEDGMSRHIAKIAGAFTGAGAVMAADEALSEVMSEAYANYEIEVDDEDD